MTTKPNLIKWVTDDSAAKISDPGSTKKLAGWEYKEKIAFQFLNWLWNKASKWFLGLQGSYYDIVIGTALQVTNNEATHVLADLDDTLVVAGSRVLFLDGTHTLLVDLTLSNDDLKFVSESPLAILAIVTKSFTFSGARNWLKLRVTGGSPINGIVVSGAGSIFEGIDFPIAYVAVSNGAVARTSGVANGLRYDGVGELKSKQIDIPDWNMDTTAFKAINHGVDGQKIKSIFIEIINDLTGDVTPLTQGIDNTDTTPQGTVSHSATGVLMYRLDLGKYDHVDYDDPVVNRGYCTIFYID